MGATWPAVGRRLTAGPCCRRGRTCVARPKPGCSSMPRWRRPRPRCRLISRRREAGMMRLLRTGLAIAILMALAGLAAWLADQPGRVQIHWRSEERRGGKECVRTGRMRGAADHQNTKTTLYNQKYYHTSQHSIKQQITTHIK